MRKTMKNAAVLFVAILTVVMCFAFTAGAKDLTYGDYSYTVLSDSTVKITKYNGSGKKVVIPSKIDGKAVTVIGFNAFFENKKIQEVILPDSIKTIEDRAFRDCENLMEITVGKGLVTIGAMAFSDTALISVDLPDTVTSIGAHAFAGCRGLRFFRPGSSVKTVGEGAFSSCDTLRSIHFGDSLVSLGAFAFESCVGLEAISIGKNIKTIGRCAFPDAGGGPCYVYYAGKYDDWYSKLEKEYDVQTMFGVCLECEHVHSFGKYYPDNNATELQDGTKSALCQNGCGYSDKIRDKGTKIPPLGKTAKLTATSTTSTITLTWQAVPNATHYQIYYLNNGTWIQCGAYVATTSQTFKNLKPGVKKNIAVRAVRVICEKDYTDLIYASSQTTVETATKALPITKVTATTSTSQVKLSWPAVQGATGYRIYLKIAGGWKTALSTTSATSHIFSNLKAGEKLTYAVRPYVKNGSAVIWSDYIEIETATKAVAPSKITTKQNYSAIQFNWTACKGATGYRIYRQTAKGWEVALSTTSKTTATLTGIKSGTKNVYAVRPYIQTKNCFIWCDYTTYTASTAPAIPALKVSSPSKGAISLNFGKVNGAEVYQLYYKTGNSSYKLYKAYTAPVNCNFKNLKSGTTYTFAVRAGVKTSGGWVYSSYTPLTVKVK